MPISKRVTLMGSKQERRGQDSNLRITYAITDLANPRFRPLSHLSGSGTARHFVADAGRPCLRCCRRDLRHRTILPTGDASEKPMTGRSGVASVLQAKSPAAHLRFPISTAQKDSCFWANGPAKLKGRPLRYPTSRTAGIRRSPPSRVSLGDGLFLREVGPACRAGSLSRLIVPNGRS